MVGEVAVKPQDFPNPDAMTLLEKKDEEVEVLVVKPLEERVKVVIQKKPEPEEVEDLVQGR